METEFFTESTRKLRKSLLVASLIGFAISYAGLRVSEVSLLGSKLSITKFEVIPLVLGIIVLYFLVTFTIFGLYEYSQWYRKMRMDILERISKGVVYSKFEAEKALDDLESELKDLETEGAYAGIMTLQSQEKEYALKIKDRTQEIKQEMLKLQKVLDFHRHYKPSVLDRFWFVVVLRDMRTLFELFVPIFVGFYVAILLFFFTKIPKLNDTTLKPEQNIIVSEKVSSNEANQVNSDTVIDNSQKDEQIK